MNKLTKTFLSIAGIIGIWFLLNWIIAGFPVTSKEAIIDKVILFYNENESQLFSIINEVEVLKNAYPDQTIKLEASVKKNHIDFYIQEKFNDKTHFIITKHAFPLTIEMRNYLINSNIYSVILSEDYILLKFNKSPSLHGEIYLVYHKSKLNDHDEFLYKINDNNNQHNWIYFINENWAILSKAI